MISEELSPCPLCAAELKRDGASPLGDIWAHPANGCAMQVAWFTATPEWVEKWNTRTSSPPSGEAGEVRVKPLEWTRTHSSPAEPWSDEQVRGSIGHHNLGPYAGSYAVYEVAPDGKWAWRNSWTSDRYPEGIEDTEAGAKAAAQSDYETRIRSALLPTIKEPTDGK